MTRLSDSQRLLSLWVARARALAAPFWIGAGVLVVAILAVALVLMDSPARVDVAAPTPTPAPAAITPPAVPPAPVAPGGRNAPGAKDGKGSGGRTGPSRSGLAGLAERLAEKNKRQRRSNRVVLAEPTSGRVGTGLTLGALSDVTAPVGKPVDGTVSVSVANVPNRTSAAGFVTALRSVTAAQQDFVLLNEVSGRSLDTVRAVAPAYGVYRDPVVDPTLGGSQSMNNAVMWRADRWNLVDAGRVKVVDDDRGYLRGRPFVWDRYATWAVLQRVEDRAVVSVVSTHMPTNPAKYPAQPAGSGISRVERYSQGMDRVAATVATLAQFGPVLLGGDMNSHAYQGAWTAAGKMQAFGFGYVRDRGVMHLFYQPGVQVLAHREVPIPSDHPAITTTLELGGVGPIGPIG